MTEFLKRLKSDRAKLNVSQKQFSELLGIEYQTYFKVEQGHRPPSELFLIKYAMFETRFLQTPQGENFLQQLKIYENEIKG